jgi:hypothetical protein
VSLFTNALAGAADAGSKVLNKYLDDEILRNRAQVMAGIQRTSAVQTEKDLTEYRQSPEVVDRGIANDVRRTNEVGDAQNSVALRGKRNEASDQTITAGLVDRGRQVAQADADVRLDAQRRALTELGGLETKLAGDKADAVAKAQAKYREKPQHAPTPAEKLAQIKDALGRDLSPQEKEALLGLTKDEGNNAFAKMVNDATQKALEGGLVKPEESGQYADKIRRSFEAVQVLAVMSPRITNARKDGEIAKAVEELRGLGYGDDQMRAFGISPEELKAIKPKAQPRAAAPAAPVASPGEYTGVEGLHPLALRRIANDPNNPLREAAIKKLGANQVDVGSLMRQRYSDNPGTDPAYYSK